MDDNTYYMPGNDYVCWLIASLESADHSVQIYGKSKELLFYNNRFKVFDKATETDLLNLYTVFSYLQKLYLNTKDAIDIIQGIYTSLTPQYFSLFTVTTEMVVQCRAFPVLANGKLLGVVVADDWQRREIATSREQVSGNTEFSDVIKTGSPARGVSPDRLLDGAILKSTIKTGGMAF